MTNYLVYAAIVYGVCFTIQHKLPFLHGKLDIIDRMLHCTFCTGFHSGWIGWLLIWAAEKGTLPPWSGNTPLVLVCWCFASATVCYTIDTLVSCAEAIRSDKE